MFTPEIFLYVMTSCGESDYVVQDLPESCWCAMEVENGVLVPCGEPVVMSLRLKMEDNPKNHIPLCWKHFFCFYKK